MSRKTALILTTALTVFVLIITAALVMRLSISTADSTAAPAVTDAPTATIPATAEAILQRESLYQQRLNGANAQLQRMNQQIRQLQAQLQQLQAQNAILLEREQIYQQRLEEANRLLRQSVPVGQSQQASAPSPPDALRASAAIISADEAAQIAILSVGGGKVRKVELEDEHGVLVYEIKVGDSKVYVDAYTGQVVYNNIEGEDHGEWEHQEREEKEHDEDHH